VTTSGEPTVAALVTLDAIEADLPAVERYAAAAGLELDVSELTEENPRFYVTFHNLDEERFFAEFDCRDYPLFPPTIEFLDATRHSRGTRALYPSCFHAMPCVCTRYSRKAYVEQGGPHNDWRLKDWQLPTQNGIAIDTLAMIVSDLHSKIANSRGRLG
jgi:hypothetical protein